MPRKPTDQVIEHRITLGAYERTMVSDVAASYQFNKVANPIVALISDQSAMLLLGASVALWLDGKLDLNWREIVAEMTPEEVKDWLETQNLVGYGVGGLIGLFFGGPIGAVAGAAVGGVAVEGGEAALEYAGELIQENQDPSTTIFIALQIYKFTEGVKNLAGDLT